MAVGVEKVKYDWESQACQYAVTGEPGVHLEQCELPGVNGPTIIDCLLHRDPEGHLTGILNHFNEGNLFQKPDSCSLWVHPEHQRQGIATALLREADRLWDLYDEDQNYSTDGDAWIEALVAQGRIDPARTGSTEGDPDSRSANRVPCDGRFPKL